MEQVWALKEISGAGGALMSSGSNLPSGLLGSLNEINYETTNFNTIMS